jgi:predicted metal-binding protein
LKMNKKKTMKNIKAEVFEHTDRGGSKYYVERLENTVRVSEIDCDEYKVGCHACKKYGMNLACPPYSPYFPEYVKGMKSAKVICFRIPLEQFSQISTEERYRTAFKIVRELLTAELLHYRKKGNLVAGSGSCPACEQCAIESGDSKCKQPGKRIYSLESLGVSVVSLTVKAFSFRLEWSGCDSVADFVSATGAVFYK